MISYEKAVRKYNKTPLFLKLTLKLYVSYRIKIALKKGGTGVRFTCGNLTSGNILRKFLFGRSGWIRIMRCMPEIAEILKKKGFEKVEVIDINSISKNNILRNETVLLKVEWV